MKQLEMRVVAAAALAALAGGAVAQSYPSKPIRWISPFAPGGGADITSRAIATRLPAALGQQVVVENRGGAGGMVGVELASKQPGDGYTLVLGTIGPIAVAPSIQPKMGYVPMRDLAPVSQAANAINLLVVHPSLPIKSVPDLIALAKKRPGELNFGSSGPGATDHLAGELFNKLAGVKMVHIPYKGGTPAMLDLMAGQVQLIFATVSTAHAAIDGKRIVPIAVTGNQRFELMPDLPTIAEAGLKGFEVNNWYGVFAPAGTPKDIVARLNAEIVKILAMPEVKQQLLKVGIVATSSSPEAFAAYIAAETKKWAQVTKEAGIRVN